MRLVVKQNDKVLNEFKYAEGPVSIGRSSDNQVVLANRAVSKKHAKLVLDGEGKWTIEDLGSANKIYLNDCTLNGRKSRAHKPCEIIMQVLESS